MRNDFSTDRILLRAPEPEDLELMFSLENEEDACNASVATGPYSRYQLKKYIAESENDLFADHQLRLMIEWKEERKTVGIIDVFDFSPRYRRGLLLKRSTGARNLPMRLTACWKCIAGTSASVSCMHTFHLIIYPVCVSCRRKDSR